MKKFLATLLAICAFMGANAAYDRVVVHFNDGGKVEIALGENVKMTFTATDLVVKGSGADVTVARDNIKSFEHLANAGVNGVNAGASHRFAGNAVEFDNLPDGSEVTVYDIAGRAVLSESASGSCRVDLSGLGTGTYVVSAAGNTFKILIK